MSKKMQQTSFANEAYFIFLWFLMKNRTHSRCYL